MSKLSATDVTGHREPLLLLLGCPHNPMDLKLMLLQLLLRRFDLAALLTLDLLSSGHPTTFHVHLQAAVEVEGLLAGFADKTFLGCRFFLRLLPFLGTDTSCFVVIFVQSFNLGFTIHLPLPDPRFLPASLSQETCRNTNSCFRTPWSTTSRMLLHKQLSLHSKNRDPSDKLSHHNSGT